jgi:PAS domain S-box-containing protein
MTVYESLKQLLFPRITVWQSHVVTILFSTLIALIVAYLVMRKSDLLLEQIGHENTIRRKTEGDLRSSEEKFFKLFHANPDWVIISSLYDGRYIDVNTAFLRMTGYSKEEIKGHTSAELNIWVDPEERKVMIPILQKEGRLSNHDVRFRMKSGEIRCMLRSAELIDLGGEAAVSNHRQSRWLSKQWTAQSGMLKRFSDHHSVVNYLNSDSC